MYTVIMPSIRKGSLEYAVDSVLKQDNPNWQLLIGGDGVEIPEFKDARVEVFNYPAVHNASMIRNTLAVRAAFPYLVFLDDDDWISPNHLDTFTPFFMGGADIVVAQMMNYGWVIPRDHELIHGSVGISFAVKRDLFNKHPMPNPPSEDYEYLVRMRDKGYTIRFTDQCTYWVRRYMNDPLYSPTV